MLRAWDDAPAIILSCAGPARRHTAAVQPVSGLSLPQCLLGGEAQLLAFAASAPALAPRLFFTPLPELFANAESAAALVAATGLAPEGKGARLVHIRFGGTRSARVMKDARNAFVLAEDHLAPPITASRHPFADGLTLPAHVRRVLAFDRALTPPVTIGGAAIPMTPLPGEALAADLRDVRPSAGARGVAEAAEGLEVISFAEFQSSAWAAGPVRARSPHLRLAVEAAKADGAPFVLVPWNLDHPGSAVPALIERTLRLQMPDAPTVRLLILPFNYPGQTGLIRRLIRQVPVAAMAGRAALSEIFIGRLTHLRALGQLTALARVAWVDGNDPEFAWTTRRLAACGITPILLAAGESGLPTAVTCVTVDDVVTITAETRFGLLHFRAKLPTLRALRQLLVLTRDQAAAPPARTPRKRPRG